MSQVLVTMLLGPRLVHVSQQGWVTMCGMDYYGTGKRVGDKKYPTCLRCVGRNVPS